LSEQSLPTVIAIDGPSGSGKGTLSQLLAQKLGFSLLDSGALYRLVALAALKCNADLTDEEQVAAIARSLNVSFDASGEATRVMMFGEDVTLAIRQEKVSMSASVVAAYPRVRAALLERQRAFRQPPGLVADGRDMGTTVFPDAPLKIFLTASARARAERRYRQLQEKGEAVDMAELVRDIEDRDTRDSSRAVSPLRPADDAILLDSTSMNIDQVLEAMLVMVRANKLQA
jgi:cytidylate kinase